MWRLLQWASERNLPRIADRPGPYRVDGRRGAARRWQGLLEARGVGKRLQLP